MIWCCIKYFIIIINVGSYSQTKLLTWQMLDTLYCLDIQNNLIWTKSPKIVLSLWCKNPWEKYLSTRQSLEHYVPGTNGPWGKKSLVKKLLCCKGLFVGIFQTLWVFRSIYTYCHLQHQQFLSQFQKRIFAYAKV